MNDDSPRDFADRMLCEALSKPENLRGLLQNAVPELADGFEFERMWPAKREFLLGNWRRRKPDVLVEIPYRSNEGEIWALVCVLVEHQTKSDWQVPLKTFMYAALYWEWQWRTWEGSPTPKAEFKLTPILPIVLHTGLRPWGSAKTLRELLGPPLAFHSFTPDWQPMFWELAKHSADELVDGPESFLQALAIFKADDAELEEAQSLFRRIFRKLDPLHETGRVHWRDLLGLILSWAQNRRPNLERQAWGGLADELETNADVRKEIQAMTTTIAQEMMREGEARGEARAEVKVRRSILLRLARRKFGPPSEDVLADLDSLTDIDRLDRMTDRLEEFSSWDDMIAAR